MKKVILLLIAFTIYSNGKAQTTVVQDSKGESTLAVGSGGAIVINSKDESISFSYGVPIDKVPVGGGALVNPNYLGITVKGKGKNGLAKIFKNDKFQYDGSIGLFYFKDITDQTIPINTYIQYYASADLLFSQFKLYDATRQFSEQLIEKNKSGYKLAVGTNYGNTFKGIEFLAGISINGGAKQNTGDLTSLEISNVTSVLDPVTLQTRFIEKDGTTAYDITEYHGEVNYFNFNADIGPKFLKQYLFLLHSRWSAQEDRKPQWNPAIGLYFMKTDAPLEVSAGIQAQVIDFDNTASSVKSRSERTVINIVAGFSF